MYTRKLHELAWHASILNGSRDAFQELVDVYLEPVVNHILGGFGNYLRHDLSLAHEAVWRTFQSYLHRPCQYQPVRGSLRFFLEVQSVKRIQQLLREENRDWHFQHLNFILARYFDNETDFKIAMLLLRKECSYVEFARLLDAGGLPTSLMLKEINRNLNRITFILQNAPVNFNGMANRKRFRLYVRNGRTSLEAV